MVRVRGVDSWYPHACISDLLPKWRPSCISSPPTLSVVDELGVFLVGNAGRNLQCKRRHPSVQHIKHPITAQAPVDATSLAENTPVRPVFNLENL